MPHLGIGVKHEDEEVLTARPLSPVSNILSQSVADVAPRPSRGLGFLSEAQRFQGDPSIQAGATTLGRGITTGGFRPPSETLEEFRASADIQRQRQLQPQRADISGTDTRMPIVSRTQLAEEAEIFVPSRDSTAKRGITPEPVTAPVLADIDFSSIEGLIKGVGSVAEFTQNLQKFNRSRGITPGGKGKKRGIKPSDIQNRIKFLQSRIDEGFATETEETGIIDELDILNQYMQSVLGVGEARASEANRQSDLQTILAR